MSIAKTLNSIIPNKTKYIRFGFENVEIIDLNIKDIIFFDIKQIIPQKRYDVISKKFDQRDFADDVTIKISKHAKNKKYRCSYRSHLVKIFRRLTMFDDIVDITFLDKEKNQLKIIYLVWSDECEDNNKYQSHHFEKGNLVIKIKLK